MGKASKWFRSILGLKKHDAANSSSQQPSSRSSSKEKRRWSFVKSYRERDNNQNSAATAKRNALHGRESPVNETASPEYEDTNKHAIAVAAATAAVAEAAVAAAQAAAEVVRLTSSSGRCGNYSAAYVSGRCGPREELAAIKIQSTFRGYLARRALRALRGLVRLQALVRGHIERKRTAEWLRRMQALLRAQARARAGRAQISETSQSSSKSSHFQQPGPPTPEKFEHSIRSKSTKYELSSALKRNASKSNERTIGDRLQDQKVPSTRIGMDDEKTDKILEIDTGKPHFNPKRRNLFHSTHLAVAASDQYSHSFTTSRDSTTHQTVPSPSSCEVQSLSPLKFCTELEESLFCTAENSPQYFSASSRGGGGGGGSSKRSPFSPTKSSGAQSYLSEYSDYPSYMAFTESSKAKLRSFSAPKQRPQCERSSSAKRYYSVHGSGESKPGGQKISGLHANFTNKAYPGSGRLDRLGMPLGHRC